MFLARYIRLETPMSRLKAFVCAFTFAAGVCRTPLQGYGYFTPFQWSSAHPNQVLLASNNITIDSYWRLFGAASWGPSIAALCSDQWPLLVSSGRYGQSTFHHETRAAVWRS